MLSDYRLLTSPGGLSSFLGTFNYTLYLLAYIESKSPELKFHLYRLLNRPSPTTSISPAPTHIASLASLLSRTRTTLRLFGLLPMYAWARSLVFGPKPGQDYVLYALAVTQCTLYTAFQFLENVAVLTDNGVLAASATARWNKSGSTAKLYFWAYRAWMFGVVCDILRLGREAQLTSQKRFSEQRSATGQVKDLATTVKEEDTKWWSDLLVPVAWMPVALQYGLDGGVPGFNLGIMGVSGAAANLGRLSGLWEATKET